MFITMLKEPEIIRTNNYISVAFSEANIRGENKEIVIKKALSKNAYPKWKQERDILSNVSHPGIAKLLGSDIKNKEIYIEKINGENLFSYTQTNYFPENKILFLMESLSSALNYLHSPTFNKNSVVHADISLSNIILENGVTLKLIDFGNSYYINKIPDFQMHNNVGTPIYMAPETFLENKLFTPKSDVYSLGIIFYFIINDDLPYDFRKLDDTNPNKMFRTAYNIIMNGEQGKLETKDPKIDKLVMSMIEKDYKNRPTSKEVNDEIKLII